MPETPPPETLLRLDTRRGRQRPPAGLDLPGRTLLPQRAPGLGTTPLAGRLAAPHPGHRHTPGHAHGPRRGPRTGPPSARGSWSSARPGSHRLPRTGSRLISRLRSRPGSRTGPAPGPLPGLAPIHRRAPIHRGGPGRARLAGAPRRPFPRRPRAPQRVSDRGLGPHAECHRIARRSRPPRTFRSVGTRPH